MNEQVRAVLALVVTGTAMFLFAVQAPIPDSLLTIVGVILTFYFMAGQTDAAVKAALTQPPRSDK